MQIPYEVQARPDTGLYNAKLGIWLFLASEVMLFGGLFSAYIFLRLGAEPGYWPHGLLNVPVGAFNTVVLIASSVTVIMAWASLKMRKFAAYKLWMGITVICGALFLIIKLSYEYPQKFGHFGAFIRKAKLEEYEKYLGNEHMKAHGLAPRVEISGHLEAVEFTFSGKDIAAVKIYADRQDCKVEEAAHDEHAEKAEHAEHAEAGTLYKFESKADGKGFWPSVAEGLQSIEGVKLAAFEVKLDQANAKPEDPENERPHFIPRDFSDKIGKIEAADVDSWSAFVPKHSTYFAVYFMITGLHGAHVLAGVLIFCFLWGPGAALYKKNPEHLANRVEVAGLFWHFVDLVWIFVFPLFYLL